MAQPPEKHDDLQEGFDRLTKLWINKQIDSATYRDEIRKHTGKSSKRIDALEARLKRAANRQIKRHRPVQKQSNGHNQEQ